MKKVAVVLSGSGVFDGSEIHESVITLLSLDRLGAEVSILAPDIPQMHVINHITGEEMNENRNVLIESARIARGDIKDLAKTNIEDYDAIIFPGGFGAAKNLSDLVTKGSDLTVNPVVEKFIVNGLNSHKVMGFICIAPVIAAKVSANIDLHPEITIGTDKETAQTIEKIGAIHINSKVNEIVYDKKNKIVTTPAYMLGQSISEIAEGIEKLVKKVLELC
jgi:enhancing lycopene biosynthesis protein 2